MTTNATTPKSAPEPVLRMDGSRPLSAERVAELSAFCDRVEQTGPRAVALVHVTGAPGAAWTDGLGVQLVNKWERALRRLERLDAVTVAVADGECGGPALEALLATDYRVATGTVRLVVPVHDQGAWPGMAVYRLANQAGLAATRRAVLFGTPITAAEALAARLVDEVVADAGTALARAALLAGRFDGPELAIRRRLMLEATTTSFEDALGSHLAACDRMLRRTAAEVTV
ncbi:enoyl-CoA-hydratase DpgB [Streptantibioticus silvisoli]|uniref:Enoyl-CoA hydratase/isomerase family protein n=1 Tax=Streptantibioticus silvisoli TaxID=2705255 RepID=A0ABT6WAJ6_9ACTN|nr:enoyl-CoA-hydratase DpgB [Streptantibioticus silvisoli]MDI5967266.1 enoyl-CoA hydratase/isomerase family protein [Streptantibioticus silvisoli]